MPKAIELTLTQLGGLCLQHLAEDPQQLAEFMVATGYTPDRLRKAAGGRALNLGLLDYFAGNEPLLLALCANAGLRPEQFMRAWATANPAG